MDPNIQKMIDSGELGEYSLEYRMCHLLLFFSGADRDISKEEVTHIAGYLTGMTQALGVEADIKELILGCIEDMKQDVGVELLKETIVTFGKYATNGKLKIIAQGIEDVVAVDGLTEEEAKLMKALKTEWKIA